jgi:hypothetical protein
VTFSPEMQRLLRHYVYLLSDPQDGEIFYIGKGTGNRVFAHAKDELAAHDEVPGSKLDQIRIIRERGDEVQYELLRFVLSDTEAFEVEAAAIQLRGLSDLLNDIQGHHAERRGRMSVDVAISLLDPQPVGRITEPVLLIKIPKLWFPTMSSEELLEATAGWWKISKRREDARYAFAISRGVIREMFKIDAWRQRHEGDRDWEDDIGKLPRWGFTGAVATGMEQYRNRSVRHLYQRGDRSVIKFINC